MNFSTTVLTDVGQFNMPGTCAYGMSANANAGDTVIAILSYAGGDNAVTVTSVGDAHGNTWTEIFNSIDLGGEATLSIWQSVLINTVEDWEAISVVASTDSGVAQCQIAIIDLGPDAPPFDRVGTPVVEPPDTEMEVSVSFSEQLLAATALIVAVTASPSITISDESATVVNNPYDNTQTLFVAYAAAVSGEDYSVTVTASNYGTRGMAVVLAYGAVDVPPNWPARRMGYA
jgi:hypothetical protein